jgi:TatD DNase family protein
LLETDCPYLGPVAGEDSEPSHVAGTHRYAAELWKCSEDEARTQLEANFEALFRARP